MKSWFSRSVVIFCLAFSLPKSGIYCQIKESIDRNSQGLHNSFSIVLQQVDHKLANQLWRDYIKKYGGKYKWDRKALEHQISGAIIGNISPNIPIDLIATVKTLGHDQVLTVWVFANNEWVESQKHPEWFEAIELQLQHFAKEVSREKLKLQIKEEERNLSKIESDLQRLIKKKESLEQEIEKAKKRIEEAEREIILNLEEQSKTNVRLNTQKSDLEALRQKLHDM